MEASLWTRCVRALEAELPERQFNTWVRPLQVVEGPGTLKMLAPNRFVVDWVTANLLPRIGEILRNGEIGDTPIVTVEIGSRIGNVTTSAPSSGCYAPGQPGRRTGGRRTDQSRLHLRHIRGGKEQPACEGRGPAGRRKPGSRLQPAVRVWRCGAWQDPSDARHSAHHSSERSRSARRLRAFRAFRQRYGASPAAQQHDRLQDSIPFARCAADRRHPVLRGQGSFAGGVLPHVQRAPRRPAPGDPHLRSISQGGSGTRGAPQIPLRLGPHGVRSSRRSSRPASRS